MAVAIALATFSLLALSGRAEAQQLTLRVDQTTLSLEDQLTLELRVEGEADEVQPPPTPGFEVVGQSQSSQFSMVNGRTSHERVFVFALAPTSAGKHRIGPAVALRGGRAVARSNTVEVEVREDEREPLSEEAVRDLDRRAGEPFFLAPVWPQRPVYVGEPFVLEMSLFARRNVSLRVSGWKRELDLSAFSAEELPVEARRRPRQERIGGQVYGVHPQSRHLVVPLEPGRLQVGGATLELVSGDFFDRRRHQAKSPPFEVLVRALPTEGRLPEFREGNVGRYELTAELRPERVKAGERVVLTARVAGSGSLETVRAPLLPELPGVEVEPLSAGDADLIEKSEEGIRGTRVFQWILVPSEEGDLEIPPLRFAWFDPTTSRYERALAGPLRLRVEGRAALAEAPPGRAIREAVTAELRDIRTDSALRSHRRGAVHRSGWYPWAVALPALLLSLVELGLLIRRRRQRNAQRVRRRRALPKAARQLRSARALAAQGQTAECFAEVALVLERFVADRFAFSPRGLTHGALRSQLASLGAEAALADDLIAELENCDFARFAPVSMRAEEMAASLERATALLERLDRLRATE